MFKFEEFLYGVGCVWGDGVYWLYGEVGERVIRKVEVDTDVNVFLVDDICPVVINSNVELFGCLSYVLFLTFFACD